MKNKNIWIFSLLLLAMPFFGGIQKAKADACDDCLREKTPAECFQAKLCQNSQAADCSRCLSENTPAQCFKANICQNVESTLPAGGPVAKKDLNPSGVSFFDSLFGGGSSDDGAGSGFNFLDYFNKCESGFEDVAGVCVPTSSTTGLSDKGVLEILANLLSWMFSLFMILSIMAFIISGIQYLVSAGDTGMIEVAKRNATWSVVGIIVGLSGYLILKAVSAALAGSKIF